MQRPTEMFSSAPNVSPDDVWGDAACLFPDSLDPATMLTSKRLMQGQSGAARGDDDGHQDSTRTFSHSVAQTSPKLEVQELLGSVVRLLPEEPLIERIPRQPVFHARQAITDEPGEAREWGASERKPIFWLVCAGLLVAAVIVGAVTALPWLYTPNGTGEDGWVVEKVANAENLNDMLVQRGEAERVFKEFLQTQSAESLLPLVRDPERVGDLIRAGRGLPTISANAPRPRISSWGAREAGSLTYGILTGTLPDYANFDAYFTISNGRVVMDWKASTAYGTADFRQLARKQGNPAEIRGWIEAADFYTIAFTENSHQAYQLSSPDKQQFIWVYAERGSGTDEELKALIKGGYILQGRKEARKVTVHLEPGPGNSLPSQWGLVELLHKEWIAP